MTQGEVVGFVDEVPVRLIHSPRYQLRKDVGSVDDLASSIAQRGLLQPIVIRPHDGYYELVAGSRRLAAVKTLELRKIPCNVVQLDDAEAFEVGLTENVQHRTLNPVDEALAFKKYVEEYGYGSESDLAKRFGKSQEYVSQRIRLLSLPKDVLDKVTRRLITASYAAGSVCSAAATLLWESLDATFSAADPASIA